MVGIAILSEPKQYELAFIVSSSRDKPDQKARQLIRSHVMRGKNRRKRGGDLKLKSWINQESSRRSQFDSGVVAALNVPLSMQVTPRMPVARFAYDMPPYALDLIFKYFTVVGRAVFPIELCLKFDLNSSVWVEYLTVDALYCHSVLWTTQSYFDFLRGVQNSRIQIQHANKTLVMLQQRLSDSELATSDATVSVVMNLVMINALVGDYKSSLKHMKGLFKMVEMRGGVTAFKENGQLQVKICRADLTMAILANKKPTFFSDGVSWEPYISGAQSISRNYPPKHFAGLDTKLSSIWADIQEFSKSANLAFQTGQKMDPIFYQEILISVLYRLLLLDVSTDSLNHAVHIGMLAFSANVFLQMQGLAVQFEGLSVQLPDCILGLRGLEERSMMEFKLWLLFVSRMLIVTESNNCWPEIEIRKTLKTLDLNSWGSVRDKLKEYLWIGVLHEHGGKKAFENAIISSSGTLKS